ncbi:MAG: hypothetical protein IIB35_12745 [Gemmatimonadetes bacterium]|nr:hypothetical protein [Gemmatimonadota bacterium]
MSKVRLICSRCNAVTVLVLLAVVVATPIEAQQTDPVQRLQWYESHLAMKGQSLFKNLPWQFLGPTNISGRMTDIAVAGPRGASYTIYAAGATGGVWKTVNEGTTWFPVFEQGPSTSIGDVTLDPSDPSIVWVGTGEANIFRSSHAGAGVFKSTDAGETWEHMGLTGTHTIPRIVVHPTNSNVVYVAASGHEWTNNEDRGVYKTTDGGESWEKILYINEMTGAIDLVMDPSNPNTLYAATWQRVREKWNDPRNESHYGGSGIYKTTDAGANWEEINNGLPEARYRGRIGIDVSRSNPNVIYAFVDNYETARPAPQGETDAYGRPRGPVIKGATLFRSNNGGRSWSRVSEENEYMERLGGTYGWVFGQVRADPNIVDRVYVMGLALNVSNDGGKTFRRLPGMHGDHHGLWIDPENSNYLINVNDGGIDISYDAGENWKNMNDDLPLVQFFNVNYDMDDPFRVYGSIQDHGSRRGVVDLSRGRHNIPAAQYEGAPGGEGSQHAIDPTDPNVVYSAGFYGSISRTHLDTQDRVNIVPQPGEGEQQLRGQWLAPFIISPHNPRVIYHGMNKLFRSMDRGDKWETISPDLTDDNVEELGDIPYQTLMSISESPFKFGLVYVGTDDGHVWITRDGGENWDQIERGIPRKKFISRIVASAYDEATVFMTQNGKRDDDFTAYVWKSTDYGRTWRSITNNIPLGPVNVIREDPKNENVLYVGTDIGVYVSMDGGQSWQVLSHDLPSTFVHDLIIHPRDDIMVAATEGRGMFAMDVRPIQQMTPEILASDIHLFDPEPVDLPQGGGFGGFGGGGRPSAAVQYYLSAPGTVTILVKDDSGNIVNDLQGTGDAGFNMAVWDLTRAGAQQGQGRSRRGPPIVGPGSYTVELTMGSHKVEGTIEVRR